MPKSPVEVKGIKGVRLKHFEQVVAAVLETVQPAYVQLPGYGKNGGGASWWPLLEELPAAARAFGTLEGQLSDSARAQRKEDQLRSMLRCVLALLPPEEERQASYAIVDFGGGSGHLSIPLALLLPNCRVVCVDLSGRTLDLLHRRAAACLVVEKTGPQQEPSSNDEANEQVTRPSRTVVSTALPNLYTFHGPVDAFPDDFDVALALHLCGEATDVVLRLSAKVRADAVVVAPCCVGKLSRAKKNPYIYQATGSNTPTVRYPQSTAFAEIMQQREQPQEDWNALAKAADYSDADECRTSRNAARRTAKALLETDRRLFLEETCGYWTALTRMEPWECTPKNDILVAWRPNQHAMTRKERFGITDQDCQADVRLTIDHLLVAPTENGGGPVLRNSVDWTAREEQEIRAKLTEFFETRGGDQVLIFPTRMGGRRRKLVHYVAEQMKLAHWCEGSKDADKTVAVARRGRRRKSGP